MRWTRVYLSMGSNIGNKYYYLLGGIFAISQLKKTKVTAISKFYSTDPVGYLDQDEFDVILFSNTNFQADQAWILCSRLGYKNHRVLKGGLNEWFNTIINPPKPTENMPASAFELYSFRKAASIYFGVAYPEAIKKQPVVKKVIPKKVIPVKKKKKKMPEGGC